MTKTTVKTVAIHIMGANKCTGGSGSYLDFCISINGQKPAADMYRIYSWEKEFHKILGFTSYGHAVRGKARKAATDLIIKMRENGTPFGIIEL